jgi:hypothetical protein
VEEHPHFLAPPTRTPINDAATPPPGTHSVFAMRRLMCDALLVAALAAPCRGAVDLNCQIFDETMVCDNEKAVRAEIRTCSG